VKRGGSLKRDPAKQREWARRSKPLSRGAGPARRAEPRRRQAVSPASPAQRKKVAELDCIVAGCERTGCHPAHLIDRSIGGDDDPRAVVPLCGEHHRAYDSEGLSLLEHLEPGHRAELAYAVELVGVVAALQRITNQRWRPDREIEPPVGYVDSMGAEL
jgi:hypothetical protein